MVYSSKYPVTYFPKDTCVYDILFGNNDNISNDKFVYIDCENPDKSLTYSQLQTQILKAAAGLKREFDLQKGDVVAICSPNHIDYPVIVHGTVCASMYFKLS
jgi:acyl-CoA synthetase (AMP-forming)/AMP-acid ligase II